MKHVISVDLGGTNIRVALVDEKCNVIEVLRCPSIKDNKELLTSKIIELIKSLNYNDKNVVAIGISACGFIEDDLILKSVNLGLENLDLITPIKDAFNLPIYLANDASSTGLSEAIFGAGKDSNTVFFITISSGIGASLVIDKQLIDLPFEFGHTLMNYKGETYEVEGLLSGNKLPYFASLFNLDVASAAELFEKATSKDPLALEVIDNYINELSKIFYNIQLTYNTDCIVLSGGVMKSSHLFLDELTLRTNALLAKYPIKKANFVLSKFDQDAGILGGAALALLKQ